MICTEVIYGEKVYLFLFCLFILEHATAKSITDEDKKYP